MSGGFPNRPGRRTFGPILKNASPVKNPELQPDADKFNLGFFQIAGSGLMVPRAWALVDGTGGGGSARLVAHAESWNPDGDQPAPVFAYTSTGLYTLTYQASYLDDNGASVVVSPIASAGLPVDSANVRNVAVSRSGGVFTIRLKEFSAGSYSVVDGPALVWFM